VQRKNFCSASRTFIFKEILFKASNPCFKNVSATFYDSVLLAASPFYEFFSSNTLKTI